MGDCGVGRTGGDSDNKASPKIGRFGCAILEIVESLSEYCRTHKSTQAAENDYSILNERKIIFNRLKH